ncbi:MAG: hypothetical protein EOP04_00955 [Proteobacteria bacterium]|nr:MAG: hypothetical protein EOP04_00955 [Pseudomonadota bacterium]
MTEDKWIEKVTPSHKVEFLTVKEKVEELLGLGYSRARIWKALREEGKLQMSLSQFRRYTEQPKTTKPDKAGVTAKVERSNETNAQPSKRSQLPPPKPFKWNPNPISKEEAESGQVTSREY